MAAYVLAEIEITNPEGYKEYTTHVPATIAQYGGRFIVRGGKAHTLELSPALQPIVADLADIIRSKEAANRPKDVAALPVLRTLLAEIRRRERA